MSTFCFEYAVTCRYSSNMFEDTIALFKRADQAWDCIMGLRAHDMERGYEILSKEDAFREEGVNPEEAPLNCCGYSARLPDGLVVTYMLRVGCL